MNSAQLDRVIRSMCEEVATTASLPDWRSLEESALMYEAAVCIVSSQMLFEQALEIANVLRDSGLLDPTQAGQPQLQARLATTLAEPVEYFFDGRLRRSRPRFKNRLALLLQATATRIYGMGWSIKELLSSADSGRHARRLLVNAVAGFGPKQASLFLRRIGYCADLAVLDTHVLNYLKLKGIATVGSSALARLSKYELVEESFSAIASGFGHEIGRVDLAMWITMRVAKREAYL